MGCWGDRPPWLGGPQPGGAPGPGCAPAGYPGRGGDAPIRPAERRGLVRPAARCAARHRRPERLASTLRPRGPRSPRTVGEPGGPGRSGCARRARVAGNIDQAARRIYGRRVQHPSPLTARPRGRRRTSPVTSGPAAARAPSAPGEREEHERDQANRETCHAQSHAQAGDMAAGAPADQVGGCARHHENPARQDHYGADHRQGDDKPHPPGRGGIRAHRSTIASWFAPRKPYRQGPPITTCLQDRSPRSLPGLWAPRRTAGDTLWP